ncbi:MAG: lipid-A-disaccharide synthase [Planctomycetota bacterium]
MSSEPSFFFVAGEPSGDLHGAHLVEELRRLAPGARCRGFGGERMRAAGMELLEDLASDAVMGIFPVIAALPRIRGWFDLALEELRRDPPSALVLIDYPGFNLRLARRARELGVPVVYYISPQIWAWHTSRVKKIERDVDLMIPILPFEEEFYRDHGVPVFFPGHPVVDHLESLEIDAGLVSSLREGAELVLGLFPGSRRHVVDSLAPVFARAVRELRARPEGAGLRVVVAAADAALAERLAREPEFSDGDARIEIGRPYEVMRAADLALTTSGTTTIELAAMGVPMVLAYRVSAPFYLVGRAVLKVPHIGLVNLVAGREVVREHIGVGNFGGELAEDLAELRRDEERRETMRRDLAAIREKLDRKGSYARTAERILEFTREPRPRPRD